MKEIYEAFMLKKKYFSDLYNYPAVFGSILKLIFLSIDLYLFHNDYSYDLANTNQILGIVAITLNILSMLEFLAIYEKFSVIYTMLKKTL